MAKIRAIVNGVSYYTTTTAIKKMTSSDFTLQNTALFYVLDAMGKNAGYATTVKLYDGKMNRHSFEIQLSKV
jgi:hypothetical protein